MKKLYYSFLFIAFCGFSHEMNAQNTCSTPILFTAPISSAACVTGYPNTDTLNNYGCLPVVDNATWMYFRACTGGNMDMRLQGNTSSDDVNFIVWGPLSTASECGLTASQILVCSAANANTELFTIPSTVAGQYYKIMITNYSGTAVGWYLTQLAGPGVACDSIPTCGIAPAQQICQVTTDPVVNHNIIIWDKDTVTYTGSYYIQKETTTMGVYATIATVLNHDTSAYEDMVSNPMIQSFRYRIGTSDTCGTGMVYGYPHETIHLLTSISSSTGYPQLAWNNYDGFLYGTYFIYRGSSPATLTMYDSISASFNSYTDVAAVPGMNYYGVAVFPPSPCTPSRMMNMKSLSNVSPVNFTGIDEHEFANLLVGPNPANDVLNFTLGNISADFTIDMIDITGRIVISKSFKNVSQEIVDVSTISNGSYVVRFSSVNGTTHKNVIIAR